MARRTLQEAGTGGDSGGAGTLRRSRGGGKTFKEALVHAISTHFGVRDVTFFHGRTYAEIFDDPAPVLTGVAAPLLPVYHEQWRDKDVFALPRSRRVLTSCGFATLDELPSYRPRSIPMSSTTCAPNDIGTASASTFRSPMVRRWSECSTKYARGTGPT